MSTLVEIPAEEQAQMRAALRRVCYGCLLARHILLLCAAGHKPADMPTVLFCSRASVYRTLRAYRDGTLGLEHDAHGRFRPGPRDGAAPDVAGSLLVLLQAPPRRMRVVPHALELCHAGPDVAA
jgi:hypothetical protein